MAKRRNSTFGKRHTSRVQYSYKKKGRDFNTPEYAAWRKEVRERDGAVCQMPKCYSKKAIKVHHIIRWADAPSLRFEPRNGICLCRQCHDRITGYESRYIKLFKSIVAKKYE